MSKSKFYRNEMLTFWLDRGRDILLPDKSCRQGNLALYPLSKLNGFYIWILTL